VTSPDVSPLEQVGRSSAESCLLNTPNADSRTTKSQKVGRNAPCPCGSAKKYKKCCLRTERSDAHCPAREPTGSGVPGWLVGSRKKLHQFLRYVRQVYSLPQLLGGFTDARRDPTIDTLDVVTSLFFAAVFRIPSINALEGDLKEADFQKLIGKRPKQDTKVFSADVVANVLDTLKLSYGRQAIVDVISKAERNKAFREGSYAAMRCVAIDGWEPFCSYHRHCPDCLVRLIKIKRASGEIEEVEQYYHRYVVALLVGPLIDVVLGIEPVRNERARIAAREKNVDAAEGELTAALRLLDSLHETYGTFIDAFIFDGLYPNGPVLTKLKRLQYDAFIVLKKEDNEPLKEALALWQGRPPCQHVDDSKSKEHIEFWDVDGLETLDTYQGKIRVIRAVVTKPNEKKKTWCVAIVGKRARRVGLPTALKITRARWHIENTAFHQWVTHWNLNHVFRHSANALMAVLLLWSLAFNLLQLFVYRRLKRPRRPKDPADTIRHIVEVMLRDVGTVPEPLCWVELLDTS
jgi:hypothetical protein